MEHHPYFALLMHSDAELAAQLGKPIASRVTLHEWPLSCVQRITLQDGQSLIYKSESGPTVEPEFYARAQSPLLVRSQILLRDSRYAVLLLEDLPAQPFDSTPLSTEEALTASDQLLSAISQIEGDPPVYLDVSAWDSWQALMDGMLQDLHGLVGMGKYQQTTRAALSAIARSASSRAVREAFEEPVGLVHHDLSAENIFLTPQGYRVIDWQRPIHGPVEIDRVLLLSSLGIDPRPYVPPGVVSLADLLHIHWLTECTRAWFPDGVRTYDQTIFHIAGKLGD